jgi:hypothetical protein
MVDIESFLLAISEQPRPYGASARIIMSDIYLSRAEETYELFTNPYKRLSGTDFTKVNGTTFRALRNPYNKPALRDVDSMDAHSLHLCYFIIGICAGVIYFISQY